MVQRLPMWINMKTSPAYKSARFLAALLMVLANSAFATSYYISANGNDANSGTSPAQAWRTLARLDQVQYNLQPGDQVLLERGGVFRGVIPIGSSGTSSSPLTYGAYGTGTKPVVAGSDVITGWQPYQGNIWKATVSSPVQYVFVNGDLMTLARYPNTGWLRMDQGTATSLHDADLNQPNGYWEGTTAVIRGSYWSYNLGEVTGHSNSTLTFPSILDSPGNYTWGYFLRNKLSELDAPGEWYHDAATGTLYLQAPNNVDPNTLSVEASVREAGAVIAWHRKYVVIQDLTFRHYNEACIRNDGGMNITVSNCELTRSYHGLRSYGWDNTYTNCSFSEIYATGAFLIDQGTVFSNNQMNDIANHPGLGENSWGYFGVRAAGSDNVLRNNVLDNIGYIGLSVDNNALVEKNVVQNCLKILNDGGGITFDNADGMIIRNNIVRDIIGNLESAATDFPNHEFISHGIYFGNTIIKNTLVQGNTVTRCAGSGIHVDHTMVASGNEIKNNVLFNNGIQLSISDWSNYNGPGAQPPYYKGTFDDVYSGNVLYSLSKDQLCMRQFYCYGGTPVDYGTFSNNRYFNPYNELSIQLNNTFAGGVTYYTLERWQAVRGKDAGSTRSPFRLPDHTTTQELSGNLVQNGNFASNVNGWSGWPTNAQVSHVTNKLDNGALKANLPDNSQYPSFTMSNPDLFPLQAQEWYRVRISLLSDAEGDLVVGLKGQSQASNPYRIAQRQVPFSAERRDLEMYFQSDRTDQAQIQFANQWTEPMYFLDNVEVTRVTAAPIDPQLRNKLFVNDQITAQDFSLPDGCWTDINGNLLYGSVNVAAFKSTVIVQAPDDLCSMTTAVDEGTDRAGFSMYPNPVPAGATLTLSGLSGEEKQFIVSDLNGRMVLRGEIPAGSREFAFNQGVASGTYILTSLGEHGRSSTPLIVL